MTGGREATIRTPDSRLRIFVSVFHTRYLEALAAQGDSERMLAAEARGAEYGAHEAAEYALAGAGRHASPAG